MALPGTILILLVVHIQIGTQQTVDPYTLQSDHVMHRDIIHLKLNQQAAVNQ